jgi:phenylalanine-4-hydroxylase
MTRQTQATLLSDHLDVRRLVKADVEAPDRNTIVQSDPDHPGFRDGEYRRRRNAISQIAAAYKPGTSIPAAPYTDQENALWQTINSALAAAHRQHACAEYLECVAKLKLPRQRVPQLSEVSDKVYAISGFRLEPVAGLVEPRIFLERLADGVFLCTQYIRHHSTPHYTPEPDVVHEIVGHAVTLASERLANLNRLVGGAVKRTKSAAALERLSRVYWFTIEFGVLFEEGKLKAYGTGLLSSAGELEAMRHAELRPLDLELASRETYDPTRYQPVLYCAESFEHLYQTLRQFLQGW